MKTNFVSALKPVGTALVLGLSLAACQHDEPQPAAPATQASADARTARNVFQPGYYRAESVLRNEPTQIVLDLTQAANTPAVAQALDAAIAQYNALNLNVSFSRAATSATAKRYFVAIDNQSDPTIGSSGVLFSNISADAGTDEFISASTFPSEVLIGGARVVEPGRSIELNAPYAAAKGGRYLTNLLVKELGHIIGVENTDVQGTRIRGTRMVEVDYTVNGIRYRKNQLNGTPVRVVRTAAPSPASVFAVGGVTYSSAAAGFTAQDQQLLRALYGK